MNEREKLLAHVAALICETTCGLTTECKSREAAQALLDAGFISPAERCAECDCADGKCTWIASPVQTGGMYGEYTPVTVRGSTGPAQVAREPVAWQKRNANNDWTNIEDCSDESLYRLDQAGWETRPLYASPVSSTLHSAPEALLDRVWGQINDLGGSQFQDNSYDQGIVDTVAKVLDIIESLGGKDPTVRHARRMEDARIERALASPVSRPDRSPIGKAE